MSPGLLLAGACHRVRCRGASAAPASLPPPLLVLAAAVPIVAALRHHLPDPWYETVVWRYSRHCFVWPTTSQTLPAVIEGLEETWAFFGGVPRYLVLDNFAAAVAGADALHPRPTRGFLEYARHRGFSTDPARPRRPRDKPRVERSIAYVRERLFKGGDFRDVADLRSAARSWCLEVAGSYATEPWDRRPATPGSGPGGTGPRRCAGRGSVPRTALGAPSAPVGPWPMGPT